MTINFALAYIPKKMLELGINDQYIIQFRHLVIQPNDILNINAYNEYYLLIQAGNDLKVVSEFGIYDLFDATINEQQYEHQGKITITNPSDSIKYIKFIQVIPKHL